MSRPERTAKRRAARRTSSSWLTLVIVRGRSAFFLAVFLVLNHDRRLQADQFIVGDFAMCQAFESPRAKVRDHQSFESDAP